MLALIKKIVRALGYFCRVTHSNMFDNQVIELYETIIYLFYYNSLLSKMQALSSI